MILITGGLGYLGGRIAKDMLDFGFQVRVGSSKTNPIIPKELSSCDVVLCDLTSKRKRNGTFIRRNTSTRKRTCG